MSFQNLLAKVESAFLSLGLNKNLIPGLYLLFIFLLPTQFGPHFWSSDSYVMGIRIDYYSFKVYLQNIVLIVLLVLILLNRIYRTEFIDALKSLFNNKIIVSILLITVLHYLISPVFIYAIGVFNLLNIIIAGLVTISVLQVERKLLEKISLVLLCAVFLESLLVLSQFVLQHSIGGVFYYLGERSISSTSLNIALMNVDGSLILRPYGTFSHPNILSGFVLISLPFIWHLKKNIQNVLSAVGFYAILLVVICTSIVTFSRAGYLVLIIYMIALIDAEYAKKKPLQLICILLSFAVLIILFSKYIIVRFMPSNIFGHALIDRIAGYTISIKMIEVNPVFGVGINNYINTVPSYISSGDFTPSVLQPVHNIYLLLAVEYGLVFLALVIVLFFRFIKSLIQLNTFRNYGVAVLSGILVLGLFDHYITTSIQVSLVSSVIIAAVYKELILDKKINRRS